MFTIDDIVSANREWRLRIRRPLRQFGKVVNGGLLLGAVVVFGLLGWSPQVRELFRIALETEHPLTLQMLFAAAAAICLSALLFFSYRAFFPDLHPDGEYDSAAVRYVAATGLFVVAAAPWVACIVSVWKMSSEIDDAHSRLASLIAGAGRDVTDSPALKLMETVSARVWPAIAILILLLVLTLYGLSKLAGKSRWRRLEALAAPVLYGIAALVLFTFAILPAVSDEAPIEMYRWLGPLATAMITAISLFAIGLVVAWLAHFSGLATYFGAVVLLVLTFTIGWLGDLVTDYLKQPPEKPAGAGPQNAGTNTPTFEQWASARLKDEKDRPKLIISAQGGGMYAAILSSLFMARIQDADPNFLSSILAISSVSGGSVGTGLFYAAAIGNEPCGVPETDEAKNTGGGGGPIERTVAELAVAPHIAPIIGNLAADVVRAPISLFASRTDRSEAFRLSLLQDCPALSRSYDETGKGHEPALVLNTTRMSNAFRVAFAPFSLKETGDGTLLSFGDVYMAGHPLYRGKDFKPSLAEAIVGSARFPGILPPLSLRTETQRHNYGDGGYADASGVTTALEMFEKVQDIIKQDKALTDAKFSPTLVMLTFEYDDEDNSDTRFIETRAPVDAVLGVRENEARKAITRAENRRKELGDEQILRLAVSPDKFGIALGLQLSKTSYETLSTLIGRPEWCKDPAKTGDNIILKNSCLEKQVLNSIPHKVQASTPNSASR